MEINMEVKSKWQTGREKGADLDVDDVVTWSG